MSKIPELNVEELKLSASKAQQWILRHNPKEENSIKVTYLPIPLHRMGRKRENSVKNPPDYDASGLASSPGSTINSLGDLPVPKPPPRPQCSLQAKVIINELLPSLFHSIVVRIS